MSTLEHRGVSTTAYDESSAERRQAAQAIAQLRTLVRAGFTGAPIDDDSRDGAYRALVYLRWWTSGHIDVLTVTGQYDAMAYRATGMDLRRPSDMSHAVVRWREHGTVIALVPTMLAWPTPENARSVRARPADPRALAAQAEARCSQ